MDIRQSVPAIYGDWLERFTPVWKVQVDQLKQKFGASIEEVLFPLAYPTDVPIIYVNKAIVLEVLKFLKVAPDCDYNYLADYTASDEGGSPRFEVIFQLFSHSKKARIRLKVRLEEGEKMSTCISVWPGCNWAEREIWDMYGISFEGHPDLRRIIMDQRWEGHPLRKDYPLRGHQIFLTPEPIDPKLLEE